MFLSDEMAETQELGYRVTEQTSRVDSVVFKELDCEGIVVVEFVLDL